MYAENRLEGGTLVVLIPMRLGRQPGRKRILAPDGSELTPPTMPQPDGVLVKALARAWRWQKLLDRGVYGSVTEIAEAEKISKSYPGFPRWIGSTGPKAAEMLTKPRIPPFTRRVRQDSATWFVRGAKSRALKRGLSGA
jgi:hypothetical protein